jgi:hypothetical protein
MKSYTIRFKVHTSLTVEPGTIYNAPFNVKKEYGTDLKAMPITKCIK